MISVTISNSDTHIGEGVFSYCESLTSITIPEGVTSIGHYAFYGTPWYSNLTDGLIYIGKVLYEYKGEKTDITSVNVKEGTVSIAKNAFWLCENLTSITIPESVTSIGNMAFESCTGLTSITIPNSVTSIGSYAFGMCTKLASITIGNSVSIIGGEAFMNCENLSEIYSLNPEPAYFDYSAFQNVDTTIPVYIPIGSKSAYQSAPEWKNFTNFIESDFTSIEGSNISTSEIKVIAGSGINICNYYGKLQVINLTGQVIKNIYVNESAQISLPKGVYIVVTENNSQKVVL